ncbi:MAG: 50S ribosomal protein L21 [Bdellovibrionaceae bacterium]|nr:50S ribosomal protein L21 [Pseudobdellovibrionaceae bacterium]MBX3033600.1 50S ribosomal protein L21 [Pseudobdellovibrionaceae bacterium]
MYAIIRTGGKQYTVKPGDVVQVGKLEQDLGSEFSISEVLLIGGDNTQIGAPLVKDATVTVVVTKQAKTRKLDVFKKKRRHSYRKWNTHRQDFTELFVKGISFGGKTAKAETEPKVSDVAAQRVERIQQKQADSRARAEARGEVAETLKAEAKKSVAKKKTAKKAAPKKAGKKTVAKKKTGAKKTAKKTSKKA